MPAPRCAKVPCAAGGEGHAARASQQQRRCVCTRVRVYGCPVCAACAVRFRVNVYVCARGVGTGVSVGTRVGMVTGVGVGTRVGVSAGVSMGTRVGAGPVLGQRGASGPPLGLARPLSVRLACLQPLRAPRAATAPV